jgi:hypothetical protein
VPALQIDDGAEGSGEGGCVTKFDIAWSVFVFFVGVDTRGGVR